MSEYEVEYIPVGDGRGKYSGLKRLLDESSSDTITLSFGGIEAALGFKLPVSARRYPAWWSNDKSHSQARTWMDAGWRTGHVSLAANEVSFSRATSGSVVRGSTRSPADAKSMGGRSIGNAPSSQARPAVRTPEERKERVGLVGCVKRKLGHAAPAAELYTSSLFIGRKSYVEGSCERWFVLSAEYGLVAPDEWIEPYDKTLKEMPASAREAWGRGILGRLQERLGSLDGLTFEIHAGKDYFAYGLRDGLRAAGAQVVIPTEHLKQGEQLAFYASARREAGDAASSAPRREEGEHPGIGAALDDLEVSPTLVPAFDWPAGVECVDRPGLYAWWVDDAGAADLSRGLGLTIDAGRIYAGLAGATWWPSGKTTDHTLGRRIGQMHLDGKVRMSTFRWTLAALLYEELEMRVQAPMVIAPASEQALTEWMARHLNVAVHPYDDRDTLADLEEAVLELLDPPLNLKHMPPTPVRKRLTQLRRRISREV